MPLTSWETFLHCLSQCTQRSRQFAALLLQLCEDQWPLLWGQSCLTSFLRAPWGGWGPKGLGGTPARLLFAQAREKARACQEVDKRPGLAFQPAMQWCGTNGVRWPEGADRGSATEPNAYAQWQARFRCTGLGHRELCSRPISSQGWEREIGPKVLSRTGATANFQKPVPLRHPNNGLQQNKQGKKNNLFRR